MSKETKEHKDLIAQQIFVTKMMLYGLHKRIEDEEDFIKRCQIKQQSKDWKTQGLVPAPTYDPLAQGAKIQHRKKKTGRRKADVWYNFFTWTQFNISPHKVIADAQDRIKMLEGQLEELEKLKENNNG